jgi:two-component system chemotaxis response regulator CheB
MKATTGHEIVVIGASAGGVQALQELVSKLPAADARDGQAIRPGQIYLAPPDQHMLIEPGRVRVVHGPKENRHRPAIDPLFRSAGWACGPSVVAVLLTGALDDGTAGLWAVKSCGGITVVQDPADAYSGDMPANALMHMNVDHCLELAEIPALLVELAHTPVNHRGRRKVPKKLEAELRFAGMETRDMKELNALGQPSAFTCPECGGSLWELHDDKILRFRCHTGHAYGAESLLADQGAMTERALYSALRALDEQVNVTRRLAKRFQGLSSPLASRYQTLSRELDSDAATLHRLLGRRTPSKESGRPPKPRAKATAARRARSS